MELALLWSNTVLLAGTYIAVRRVSGRPAIYTPDAFVFATGSHTIGALIIRGTHETAAIQHISMAAFISFFSAILFTVIVVAVTRPNKPLLISSYFNRDQNYRLALMLVAFANLGIIAGLLLNPAISRLIIAAFFLTDETSLLVVRKAITASTEGYMSPGLIKLVRDVISPIVFVSFILSTPKAHRSTLLWFSVICALVGILIGGQRFPMLLVIVALAIGFNSRLMIDGRQSKFGLKKILLYSVGVLFVFYLMSSLLGRTEEGGTGPEAIWWSVASIFIRIFSTVPLEAEKTFEFWSTIGPTWGLSWLSDLAILLPGKASGSLSSELHQLGGGSAEGNAPLFFAIDAWFAFGWFGVPLASFLFVLLLNTLDTILWTYRSPRNDAARIVLYLNVPLMYSPFLFLLYGGLIVLVIVFWTLITRVIPSSLKQGRMRT